jgi:hypothetical protein
MKRRIKRIIRWIIWVFLALLLLPVASLIMIKMTGSMKMRKSDDEILGAARQTASPSTSTPGVP